MRKSLAPNGAQRPCAPVEIDSPSRAIRIPKCILSRLRKRAAKQSPVNRPPRSRPRSALDLPRPSRNENPSTMLPPAPTRATRAATRVRRQAHPIRRSRAHRLGEVPARFSQPLGRRRRDSLVLLLEPHRCLRLRVRDIRPKVDHPYPEDDEVRSGTGVRPKIMKPATAIGNKRQLNYAESDEHTITQEDTPQIPPKRNRIKQEENHE